MKDRTTRHNIFKNLVGVLDKIGGNWTKVVNLARDEPQMVGKKLELLQNSKKNW